MNKKLILGAIIGIVIVSIFFSISSFQEPKGAGRVPIEETRFHEVNYVDIDMKFLTEFGLEKGFNNADSYVSINPENGRAEGISHTSVISMDNSVTKQLESFLVESNKGKTHDNHYFLKYENKSFWLGIFYCDPDCPHFVEGELVE